MFEIKHLPKMLRCRKIMLEILRRSMHIPSRRNNRNWPVRSKEN